MTTEIWARKAHPACWELVAGHWRMTQNYHEMWTMFLSGEMDETKFRQRQQELMSAYESNEPPF